MKQKKRTQVAWVLPKRAPTPSFFGSDMKWQKVKCKSRGAKKFTGDFSSDLNRASLPTIDEGRNDQKSETNRDTITLYDDQERIIDIDHEPRGNIAVEKQVDEVGCDNERESSKLSPKDKPAHNEDIQKSEKILKEEAHVDSPLENLPAPAPANTSNESDVSESYEQQCYDLGFFFQGLWPSNDTTNSPSEPVPSQIQTFFEHFVEEPKSCEHCKVPFSFMEKKVADFVYVDACKVKGFFHPNCLATRTTLKSARKELLLQVIKFGALQKQEMRKKAIKKKQGKHREKTSNQRKSNPTEKRDQRGSIFGKRMTQNRSPSTSRIAAGSSRSPSKKRGESIAIQSSPSPPRRRTQVHGTSRSPTKRGEENEWSYAHASRKSHSSSARSRSPSKVLGIREIASRWEKHRMLGRLTPTGLVEREIGMYHPTNRRKASSEMFVPGETTRYQQLLEQVKSGESDSLEKRNVLKIGHVVQRNEQPTAACGEEGESIVARLFAEEHSTTGL